MEIWEREEMALRGLTMVLQCVAMGMLGYTISLLGGALAARLATDFLWNEVEQTANLDSNVELPQYRTSRRIAYWNGISERFLYTSAIIVGKPETIAVWLTFKAVMRWKIFESDPRDVDSSAIYNIGTIISLSFGVIGGLIATQSCHL